MTLKQDISVLICHDRSLPSWHEPQTDLIINNFQNRVYLLIREYLENKTASKCRLHSPSLGRLGFTQLPTAINFTVMARTLHHVDKFLKVYWAIAVCVGFLVEKLVLYQEHDTNSHINQEVALLLRELLSHVHHYMSQLWPGDVAVPILQSNQAWPDCLIENLNLSKLTLSNIVKASLISISSKSESICIRKFLHFNLCTLHHCFLVPLKPSCRENQEILQSRWRPYQPNWSCPVAPLSLDSPLQIC